MSRQRFFTDEFKLNDGVRVIRHRHGWEDGRVAGKITALSATYAEVTASDGSVYQIEKPRDISR